jgi:hypothetical protein
MVNIFFVSYGFILLFIIASSKKVGDICYIDALYKTHKRLRYLTDMNFLKVALHRRFHGRMVLPIEIDPLVRFLTTPISQIIVMPTSKVGGEEAKYLPAP